MSDEKNYHSLLLRLSNAFDEIIEEIKDSYVDEKYSNWFLWLLTSPFKDWLKLGKVLTSMDKTISTSGALVSLFPWLSVFLGYVVTLLNGENSWIYMGVFALIGYILILPFYFTKLLTFKSGHFHLGAYKKFRNQEYNLFRAALLDDKQDFFFKGLYDYVGSMRIGKKEFERVHEMIETKIDRFLSIEKHQLETKNSILSSQLDRAGKKHEEVIEEYDAYIDRLFLERDKTAEGVEFVIHLIKDINNVLFRIKNGIFSTKDLNLISGFTLFKVQGTELIKIEDVGTTGSTPHRISMDSKKNWGVVKAISSDTPVINYPYSNHTIVSFRMNMGIDSKEKWVYNFHFDSDNKKANNLLVKGDIIESREIYRLIHALCLLSSETMTNIEEAVDHGN